MAEMISEMTAEEIIKELPKGLIKWCEFGKDRKALYITGHSNLDSSLQETLSECGLYVEVTDRDHMEMCSGKYAYILIATAIERNQSEEAAVSLLKKARTLMEEYGKLFHKKISSCTCYQSMRAACARPLWGKGSGTNKKKPVFASGGIFPRTKLKNTAPAAMYFYSCYF